MQMFCFFFQIPLQLHFGIHALQLFEEQNGRSPEIRWRSKSVNILKQEMGGFGRIPSGFSDQDGYQIKIAIFLCIYLKKKVSLQLWNRIETGYATLWDCAVRPFWESSFVYFPYLRLVKVWLSAKVSSCFGGHCGHIVSERIFEQWVCIHPLRSSSASQPISTRFMVT